MATGGVEIRGPGVADGQRILTPDALSFVAGLQREFGQRRDELLSRRKARQRELNAGGTLGFLPDTSRVREGEWHVAPAPPDLHVRKVEITGPTDRKMVINALNSGASVYMADFEDANTPTWENMVGGQANLSDAIRRRIGFTSPEGKRYELNARTATLVVRPRGWHLPEKHLVVDGKPVAGALMDFGLYFFHNARELLERGTGPYLYLPKLESHLEARLWNDVFLHAQETLGVPNGSVKATVLIEVVTSAFEMDEILYELREHSGGLNAGRWDYIFSIIKKFQARGFTLPDRGQITMTVPFMRAYTELLVKTCHRRGAFALGGMAAFIPNRRDPAVTEAALAKVSEDKVREANDGFDGTWVAHPDLVETAMTEFDRVLGTRKNQLERRRDEVEVTADQLLDFTVPGGTVTDGGVRANVSVGIQYIASWLRGTGAAAINNLMEDAATAEISRSQVWQWIRHRGRIEGGRTIDAELVRAIERAELAKIEAAVGAEAFRAGRYEDAARLFETVALPKDFVEFLTLPGYDALP
ncbi:MAG TPA: malate synthase A [Candidatus Limnocylindrales bacterium]|nr:malate synthase A [Candidatus Limnocylindrales bacterium]